LKPGYIVTWPEGKPLEWRLVPKSEPERAAPVWHEEARKLRAAGWSLRRIADRCGVSHMQVKRVCHERGASAATLRRNAFSPGLGR
jgi:hypothetical protein